MNSISKIRRYLVIFLMVMPFYTMAQQQYVSFKVYPRQALLRVNGRVIPLDGDSALVRLKYGLCKYSVSCANYRTKEGEIRLGDSNIVWREQVNLSPAFGWIRVNGNPADGAVLYLDNEKKGSLAFYSDPLPSGQHNIKVVRKNYRMYDTTVLVMDNETVELDPIYKENGVRIAFVAENGTEIFVDGVFHGKGEDTVFRYYPEGPCGIEVRKRYHYSSRKNYRIDASWDNKCVALPQLKPQYGNSLRIDVNGLNAEVWIDGDSVGMTPVWLNYFKSKPDSHLLAGNHHILLKRDGFEEMELDTVVESNSDLIINVALKTLFQTTFSSNAVLDSLVIDGVPHDAYSVHLLPEGEHSIIAFSKYYEVFSKTVWLHSDSTFELELSPKNREIPFSINGVDFKMIFVEGGTYSTSIRSNDKDSMCQITVPAFYIGQCEVTRALWNAVNGGKSSKSMTPMVASWNEIGDWLKALNSLQTDYVFRLPREEEWEFAARGGIKSEHYYYAGSNSINDVAWYLDNCSGWSMTVMTKIPNELGLYDMSGNIAEWCYSKSDHLVACGGSYYSMYNECEVTSRHPYYNMNYIYRDVGFRLVMEYVK